MSHADPTRQHYGLTLAVLSVGALAFALSQTMVAPALPELQHEFGASTTAVTWVLTAYLLSASVATPIAGRLGDMFGKERLLLIVQALFALGSLIAALGSSLEMVIAGRAIQGLGGAAFPLSFGIIRDEFPREKVATGIGLISATFGIGGGAGLVLAGLMVDHLSYHWIFWLGLIVVVIAIVTTHLFVPESPVKSPAKIDWGGALLLSAALVCLLLGVSEGNTWGWDSAAVLGLFAAALVLFAVWGRFELRVEEPLVDLRLMAERPVLTTNVAGMLVGFGMFGAFICIPQFVQAPEATGYGFGASVTEASFFMLPSAAVMLVGGPLAGVLGTRFGSKLPLLIGTAVTAASFAFLAAVHDGPWAFYAGGAVQGLGMSFAFAAMGNLVVEAVDATKTGVASGINTIMRTIGGSVGSQVTAAVLAAHHLPGSPLPAESAFTLAFVISAIGVVAAFAAALLIPGRTGGGRRLHGAPEPAAARA